MEMPPAGIAISSQPLVLGISDMGVFQAMHSAPRRCASHSFSLLDDSLCQLPLQVLTNSFSGLWAPGALFHEGV